jgi:NAD(P)-dependent dehydrogenase (short-subunit alcohol dehydrogenase family)
MLPTIVITGASKGLGLCLAERYAAARYMVFAGQHEPSEGLRELVKQHPEQVFGIELDVTDPTSVEAAQRVIASQTSAVDVLINNAGVLPAAGRGQLGALAFDVGLHMYNVNALGPLRVTQALEELLRQGSYPLIINVSSEAGSIGDCWRTEEYFYCMSKAALNMQSAILKNYLRSSGIQVLAVHPGWMRTEMGGPEADIDPSEAAAGIYKLSQQRPTPELGIYLDYRGRPLHW